MEKPKVHGREHGAPAGVTEQIGGGTTGRGR